MGPVFAILDRAGGGFRRSSILVFLWTLQSLAGSAAASDFPTGVQPLLKARCVRCHGPTNPKGGLDLSTAGGLARGGDSGALVTGGPQEESLLWRRVSAGEMPPEEPLGAAELAVLKEWLAQGAPGLALQDPGLPHWAFRALPPSPLPPVRELLRARTEVDVYILSRLEPRGLSLAPDAELPAQIRRVSLDTTGLPPAPAEVQAFVNDPAPDAYERLLDRYLASPHFGEHWGKHWLDAAGYADSNGYFSADTDRPHAYRYRDYVIRSVNANKPFDRFLREQLAGDELAGFRPGQPTTPEAIEQLIATHFLRNGQDGTDIGVQEPEAFEIDRRAALEAAVQVTASSLLGLTVHCARCHDHKFEPITQQEYYQLQAVLFPAFNPQDWVNPKDRIAYAYLPGEKETWEQEERRIQEELTSIRAEFQQFLASNREPAERLLHESFSDDTWQQRWSNTAPGDSGAGGQVTIGGSAANAAQVVDGALRIIAGPQEAWLSTVRSFDWTPEQTGDWIQVSFDLVDHKVGGGPAERIGYTLAAQDFDDNGNQAGGNLLVDGNPGSATTLYLDYPGADHKVIGQIGLQGYVPGRNYGVRVTSLGEKRYRLEHLVDGLPDGETRDVDAADLPDGGFAFFFSSSRSYIVDEVRVERDLPRDQATVDVEALRARIAEKRESYEERRKGLEARRTPEPGRAIAWVTDRSATPPQVPFLTRGLYHLRGPNVEPGALQVLSDAGQEYRPLAPVDNAATTGRRGGFADWLLRADGRPAALVARVHANRIWHAYFGRGIVATTDNLGQSGAAPSHPEMLNALAGEFLRANWNLKALHRRILISTTYRQSSAPRPEGLAADAANRLLWRWPMRRLQAEVIRDASLSVAGQLDPLPYGPYVPTRQTPVGEVIVDEQDPGARRRSVYLQQRRSQTLSLLKVFDSPSIATVCTARPSSTVPLQSLALLNSDFALSASESFARRLLAETDGTDGALVSRAWQLAVAREPSPAEAALAAEFLQGQRGHYAEQATVLALADLCQMLLASNAFLYLE